MHYHAQNVSLQLGPLVVDAFAAASEAHSQMRVLYDCDPPPSYLGDLGPHWNKAWGAPHTITNGHGVDEVILGDGYEYMTQNGMVRKMWVRSVQPDCEDLNQESPERKMQMCKPKPKERTRFDKIPLVWRSEGWKLCDVPPTWCAPDWAWTIVKDGSESGEDRVYDEEDGRIIMPACGTGAIPQRAVRSARSSDGAVEMCSLSSYLSPSEATDEEESDSGLSVPGTQRDLSIESPGSEDETSGSKTSEPERDMSSDSSDVSHSDGAIDDSLPGDQVDETAETLTRSVAALSDDAEATPSSQMNKSSLLYADAERGLGNVLSRLDRWIPDSKNRPPRRKKKTSSKSSESTSSSSAGHRDIQHSMKPEETTGIETGRESGFESPDEQSSSAVESADEIAHGISASSIGGDNGSQIEPPARHWARRNAVSSDRHNMFVGSGDKEGYQLINTDAVEYSNDPYNESSMASLYRDDYPEATPEKLEMDTQGPDDAGTRMPEKPTRTLRLDADDCELSIFERPEDSRNVEVLDQIRSRVEELTDGSDRELPQETFKSPAEPQPLQAMRSAPASWAAVASKGNKGKENVVVKTSSTRSQVARPEFQVKVPEGWECSDAFVLKGRDNGGSSRKPL